MSVATPNRPSFSSFMKPAWAAGTIGREVVRGKIAEVHEEQAKVAARQQQEEEQRQSEDREVDRAQDKPPP